MTSAEHRKGVLLMIGATLCWSTAGMLVRKLSLTDGWEITFWRSLFMTVFVMGVLFRQYGRTTFTKIRAVGRLGLVIGALWTLMYVSFILALGRTTVANVLVLSSISPFVAALMGGLFLHEKVPGRTLLAMLAAFGGIVLMFVESIGSGGLIGNLIALAIPLGFACNVVLLRKMHASVDMIPTVVISGVISMAVTGPLAWPIDASSQDLGLLAIMGVVQLAIGLLLMLAATPRLKAAEIGLLSVTETIFGTFLTWLVIGEKPGELALIGGLIVIAALVINEAVGLREKSMTPSEETAASAQTGH